MEDVVRYTGDPPHLPTPMNRTSRSTAFRAAGAGLFAVLAAVPFSGVFAQNGPDGFWAEFVALIPNNDPEVLMRLVRKRPDDAVFALPRQVQAHLVTNDAAIQGERIEKLVQAWKDAYKTTFLDKYYDDIRGFDQGQWNDYNRTTGRYYNLVTIDGKRRGGTLSAEDLGKFTKEAVEVAGIFETMGDRYLAATAYFWAGASLDPENHKDGVDLAQAVSYYEKCTKLREALDHKDGFYNDVSGILERKRGELKKGGTPKPKDAPPAKPGASPTPSAGGDIFAKGSAWVTSPAKFLLAPPDEIERPGWNTDGNYLDWITVGVDKKPGPDASMTLPFFSVKEAKFIREENAKYVFDPGDKNSVPLKLGRPMTFECKLPSGGGVEYGFTAALGSNQESFHGTSLNYAPTDNRTNIMYTSAASRVVDIVGAKIRVFDDNCDGKFGSDPFSLADFKGQMKGPFPLFDAMLLPGGKKAVPFSGVAKLGAKWYRFKSDSEQLGTKFQVRELDIKTGTLKVNWSGPAAMKPHYLIFAETGEFVGAFFDALAAGDKGIEVPAGEYQFYYGMFRNGKGRNYQKYAMVAPENAKKFRVEPGKPTVINMGAPFKFVAKTSLDASEVSVTGKSVEIQGADNERYVLLSDETPRPKVEWRKPGAKSGTAFGEMKRPTLGQKDSPDILCWPEDFKAKRPEAGPMEFRLMEEHKWFGVVASEWFK